MQELLNKYKSCAIEHGRQTANGNSVAANRAYDELLETLRALWTMKSDFEVLKLLEDENASVRLWAGAHSLELDERKALAALSILSVAGIPLTSMSAKYTIQGWMGGDLRVRQKFCR